MCGYKTEPFNHLSDHEWRDVQEDLHFPREQLCPGGTKQKQIQTTEPCDALTDEMLIKIPCTFFQQANELLQKRIIIKKLNEPQCNNV